jgi:hypothetical protein
MSATARRNGWTGFDIGEKVAKGEFGHGPPRGGWLYHCDGMPTMTGCGSTVVVPRRWSRVGVKKNSGWYVCYGMEPKPGTPGEFDDPEQWKEDEDVVLTFCPSCAKVVKDQERTRERILS